MRSKHFYFIQCTKCIISDSTWVKKGPLCSSTMKRTPLAQLNFFIGQRAVGEQEEQHSSLSPQMVINPFSNSQFSKEASEVFQKESQYGYIQQGRKLSKLVDDLKWQLNEIVSPFLFLLVLNFEWKKKYQVLVG